MPAENLFSPSVRADFSSRNCTVLPFFVFSAQLAHPKCMCHLLACAAAEWFYRLATKKSCRIARRHPHRHIHAHTHTCCTGFENWNWFHYGPVETMRGRHRISVAETKECRNRCSTGFNQHVQVHTKTSFDASPIPSQLRCTRLNVIGVAPMQIYK